MLQECAKHYFTKTQLEVTANRAAEMYENIEATNLRKQRERSMQVYKREMNLAQWIERYDRDVVPRHFQNEDLKAELAELMTTYEELRSITVEQQVDFDLYLNAKSFLFYDDTIYHFISVRAARVVQNWFRTYGMPKWRILEVQLREAAKAAAARAAKAAKKKKKKKKK